MELRPLRAFVKVAEYGTISQAALALGITQSSLSRIITGTYAEIAHRQTRRVLTCEHEWDEHPVMQDVRRSRIAAGKELWVTGMPWQAGVMPPIFPGSTGAICSCGKTLLTRLSNIMNLSKMNSGTGLYFIITWVSPTRKLVSLIQ